MIDQLLFHSYNNGSKVELLTRLGCVQGFITDELLWSFDLTSGGFLAASLLTEWKSLSLSDCLWPHGLYSQWNSPGQNTGVGSLFLLQGILSTQRCNPGLPHCRQILYKLSHKGSPLSWLTTVWICPLELRKGHRLESCLQETGLKINKSIKLPIPRSPHPPPSSPPFQDHFITI